MRNLNIKKQIEGANISVGKLEAKYGPNTGVTSNTGVSKKAPSAFERLTEGISDAFHNAKTLARNVDSALDKNTYAGGETSGGYRKIFTHGD